MIKKIKKYSESCLSMICIRHQYKWCWKHILINFFIMNVQFVCIFNIHKLFLYNIDCKEKIVVIIKK